MLVKLTPVQVLDILAKRLEDQADSFERVNIPDGYTVAISQLRRYARMIRDTQSYHREQGHG